MFFGGGAEQISLRAIIAGEAEALFEAGVKRDGIERHLDADRSRELGADPAHAFAGGSFTGRGFAFDDQNVRASIGRKVIGNAGANDAGSNDHDICALHEGFRGDPAF